ncbi:MAG: methionyl-tRNA formyltransferase [Deinococcota bacterium]|jgi:methionyl-tRNA formyltransferase|nr:methionyl-tRNA formyltransferase [Deinococcota bacterium]
MRLALFASPDFGLPVLAALNEQHQLALVVAQPDKAAGRGMRLTAPPVARRARELGLKLEQPARLRGSEAFRALLQDAELDAAVTAAYGKILPRSLLSIPRHGFLNVHASLLPKYRGAAPIQAALIDGERATGVTIMQTEAGLDTGPIRLQRALAIGAGETAPELSARLAALGAKALLEALDALETGTLPLIPQDEDQASHARLLSKDDGRVRWGESARAIYNRFRGVYAWPGSWTEVAGGPLKLRGLHPAPGRGAPGEVLELSAQGVKVAAGEGAILLKTVQPPGKPSMDAYAWAHGYGIEKGTHLG